MGQLVRRTSTKSNSISSSNNCRPKEWNK